jgi:hypothetical protein
MLFRLKSKYIELAVPLSAGFQVAGKTIHPLFSAFHGQKTAFYQLLAFPGATDIYLSCNIYSLVVVKCDKSTGVRNRNTIRTFSLAVLLAGTFLVLWAAGPSEKQAPCKESMDHCSKNGGDESNKMSWETLPHQFFSSFSLD